MNSTALRYADFLQKKREILESIHQNTIAQSQALESKDDDLLEKLLKERGESIKSFAQIMCLSKEIFREDKDDEIIKKEQEIDSLVQNILRINGVNAEKAESRKSDIAGDIKKLKLSRNPMRNKFFKKMPQRFGYFIDKRI